MTGRRAPTIALIVPVYREPEADRFLAAALAAGPDEMLVVEAGDPLTRPALDVFCRSLAPHARARVMRADRGRAAQMHAGARAAHSDILLFLHADTALPPEAIPLVRDAVARGALWGRFDVRLTGERRMFRLIERLMNLRSALTDIATGDQAIFVRRDVYAMLGGFAPIPLMEDIELCTRLKWVGRPARLRAPVVTSSRRWEQDGMLLTVSRMWALRALYALGVSPERLARWYKVTR